MASPMSEKRGSEKTGPEESSLSAKESEWIDIALPFAIGAEENNPADLYGQLVRLGPALSSILHRQSSQFEDAQMSNDLKRELGEMIVMGAALALEQKRPGILSIGAQPASGAGMVADACFTDDPSLPIDLRGRIQKLPDNEKKTDAQKKPEGGLMTLTVDLEQSPRIQGIVELGPSLDQSISTYFTQSVQRRFWCKTVCDPLTGRGAALVLQQWPGKETREREQGWDDHHACAETVTPEELLDMKFDTLLLNLFHTVRTFPTRSYADKCRCSRQRMIDALKSIAPAQRQDLRLADGSYSVTCEFCVTTHSIIEEDLRP